MCVIAYKPRDIAMPSNDILKNCWDRNSDGAGFMYRDLRTGALSYQKGFMNFGAFMDALNSIENKNDLDMAFHFRITTRGGTSQEMTHPFPVTDDIQETKILEMDGGVETLIMHNGTFSGFGTTDISDSAEFAHTVVGSMRNPLDDRAVKVYTEIASTNKILLFNVNGIITIGKWEEVDGIHYSNTFWKPYTATSYNYTSNYADRYTSKYSRVTSNSTYTQEAWNKKHVKFKFMVMGIRLTNGKEYDTTIPMYNDLSLDTNTFIVYDNVTSLGKLDKLQFGYGKGAIWTNHEGLKPSAYTW